MRTFNSNVKAVLVYVSETEHINSISSKLQVFIKSCLWNIFEIRRPEKISNRDPWARTKEDPITHETDRKKVEVDGTHPKNHKEMSPTGP